jgi:hypothetical protein
VQRHHGATAILVTEEMVAASDAGCHESRAAKGIDQFGASDPRISAHAAMTTR